VDERLVTDGNVITAAGVTAGIDLGLLLAERLRGPGYAAALSLQAEMRTGKLTALEADLLEDVRDVFSGLMRSAVAE
jgi:transcriptional regulator GlxA family with amidase domain